MRRIALLLKPNRSAGLSWSSIPDPPPAGRCRVYGTHSVIAVLNQFLLRSSKYQHRQQVQGIPTVDEAKEPCIPLASPPSTEKILDPEFYHRKRCYKLYVRDLRLKESSHRVATGPDISEGNELRDERSRNDADGSNEAREGAGVHDAIRELDVVAYAEASVIGTKGRFPNLVRAVRIAAALGIPVEFVERNKLTQLCGERRNQNVVLEVDEHQPRLLSLTGDLKSLGLLKTLLPHRHGIGHIPRADQLQSHSRSKTAGLAEGRDEIVVFLDRVLDPMNLGNILRSAYFFGVRHVILSYGCATVTPAAVKASTGLAEYMTISRLDSSVNSARFVGNLKRLVATASASSSGSSSGLAITSLEVIGSVSLEMLDMMESEAIHDRRRRLTECSAVQLTRARSADEACVRLLLFGNEDRGLDRDLLEQSTMLLHIPSTMRHSGRHSDADGASALRDAAGNPSLSLNVGNACAIALCSVSRLTPKYSRIQNTLNPVPARRRF